MATAYGTFSLDRMVSAVEKVRERMLRTCGALEKAGLAYAVVGGNAVAAWVSKVDESAVRNTQDVDILIRRDDLPKVTIALEQVGFTYRHVGKFDIFLDGPSAKMRDAVHLIFAGEKVRESELLSNPDVSESVVADRYRVLKLDALVRIKLTAFHDKDRMHLRDLLDVGLVDSTWLPTLPNDLADRLKALIDTPDG